MTIPAAALARVAVGRRLGRTALRRLQDRKLRRIVRHAADRVPFYRERFREARIDPREIRSVSDLGALPVITRAELQEAGRESLLPRGIDPETCLSVRTSGSSGAPLEVLVSRRDLAVRQAVELRTLIGAGFRPWDRLVSLGRTRPLEERLHRRLGLFRSWTIPPTMPLGEQVRFLRAVRPTLLWAYPTALRALMDFLDDDLRSAVRPRLLITAAERLDDTLRQRFLTACPVEILDFYGAVEVGRIAYECRAHAGLHVNADFLLVECLPEPSLPPGLGRVAITTLEAFAMPLLRYRIGDLSSSPRDGCQCASPFPVIGQLAGREGDLIRLPSGRHLPSHSLDAVLRTAEGLRQYLVIQETPDRLRVLLAPGDQLGAGVPDLIRRRLATALGEVMEIAVEVREPWTETGPKARAFISKLRDTG